MLELQSHDLIDLNTWHSELARALESEQKERLSRG